MVKEYIMCAFPFHTNARCCMSIYICGICHICVIDRKSIINECVHAETISIQGLFTSDSDGWYPSTTYIHSCMPTYTESFRERCPSDCDRWHRSREPQSKTWLRPPFLVRGQFSVHAYTHACIFLRIYVWLYAGKCDIRSICMLVWLCTYVWLDLYLCIYTCTYECVYHTYIDTYTHIHTYIHTYVYIYIYIYYTHMAILNKCRIYFWCYQCIHMNTHIHTHEYSHTYTWIFTHILTMRAQGDTQKVRAHPWCFSKWSSTDTKCLMYIHHTPWIDTYIHYTHIHTLHAQGDPDQMLNPSKMLFRVEQHGYQCLVYTTLARKVQPVRYNTPTRIPIYTLIYIRTCIPTYPATYLPTYIYIHTQTHTHTHTDARPHNAQACDLGRKEEMQLIRDQYVHLYRYFTELYACICMHVRMHSCICMCVCVYSCMYVCLCMRWQSMPRFLHAHMMHLLWGNCNHWGEL